ncbi:MAG: cation transporter, partial [Mucinivorans sp.]
LSNVYKNMRQTIKILMQAVPIGMDIQALQNDIEAIDGVESLHDLHVWTLDGTSHIMTLHVATTAPTQPLKDAIFNLAEHYDIKHITIEFETHGDICRCNCDK